MDIFFTLLKKSLVATMFIVFAFVATYIPQPYNNVSEVEAGGIGGGSNVFMQGVQNVTGIGTNIATTISSGLEAVTSYATNMTFLKGTVLDGIGWALAKAILSGMVSNLVDWINSGFDGSPAFVQDIQGFLLRESDEFFGEYLDSLGGFGSFVCSPFRLDVQLSLALQYELDRTNEPATCTLSGVIDNIEGFIEGGSFREGGWKDWFTITAQPQTYTPYGSALSAQAGQRVQLINAENEKVNLLSFGDGFLSGETCNEVNTPSGPREDCFITKPGQVISEALTLNLDSGRQTLVAADEINEVISALLGQLANKALTGATGLLGLSGGTGYTYSGYDGGSFSSELRTSSAGQFDYVATILLLEESLKVQEDITDIAIRFEERLNLYVNNPAIENINRKDDARVGRDEAREIVRDTMGLWPPETLPTEDSYIGELNDMIERWNKPDVTEVERLSISEQFTQLDLYQESEIRSNREYWVRLLR